MTRLKIIGSVSIDQKRNGLHKIGDSLEQEKEEHQEKRREDQN